MEKLLQDLRFGVRMMVKSPGFTAVAVLALALGIGANSAIFSVINTVLLRPLPFEQPERIVNLYERWNHGQRSSFSYPNFVDVKQQNRSFASVAGFLTGSAALTGGQSEPEAVRAVLTTSDLFGVLGVKPLLGRPLVAGDDRIGAAPVAVVGHRLWQRRFAADPGLVGRRIKLDGRSVTVVGIMPPSFRFPVQDSSELWIPLGADPHAADWARQGRDWHFLQVIGRLRADTGLDRAREDMAALTGRLKKLYPRANGHKDSIEVISLHERLVGGSRPALLILMAAVAFILLIACANVASLLLARSAARQREVAIRVALGAGRGRLVRQFLTESVLLACTGGALGVLLSLWGVDLLVGTALSNLPRVSEVRVDAAVLGTTAAVAVFTGLLFGLAPALAATRPVLHGALKEGAGRHSGGSRRHRVQSALVVAQVALALVLLAGAGLMIRSVARLQRVDPGFDPDHVLSLRLSLPEPRYGSDGSAALYRRLLEEVARLPGVESVGVARPMPFDGNNSALGIQAEGQRPGYGLSPVTHFVSPSYFTAMGIPLRAGRTFRASELDGKGARVVIINHKLARRFWPRGTAIGRHLKLGLTRKWYEIVGVAGDVKQNALDEPAPLQMYFPYPGDGVAAAQKALIVRSATAGAALSRAVRDVIHRADPDLPVAGLTPLRESMAATTLDRRSVMILLGVFAGLALLLAAIGLYGVIAHSVTERTHEIGIRAALGCRRGAILRLVVGKGVRLTAVGVGVGLAAALAATRLLESLLYGVDAVDPATFALIAGVLGAVALAASVIPAWRATRVDPMIALRAE